MFESRSGTSSTKIIKRSDGRDIQPKDRIRLHFSGVQPSTGDLYAHCCWCLVLPAAPPSFKKSSTSANVLYGRVFATGQESIAKTGSVVEFKEHHIFDVSTHQQSLLAWYMSFFKEALPTHPLHPSKLSILYEKILVEDNIWNIIEWYQVNGNDDTISEKEREGVFALASILLGQF
jgi:hypothetical protein